MSDRFAGDRENEGKGKSAHVPPQSGGSCSGCRWPGIGLSRLGRPRFRGGECQRAVRLAENGFVRANGAGIAWEGIGRKDVPQRPQPHMTAKGHEFVTAEQIETLQRRPVAAMVLDIARYIFSEVLFGERSEEHTSELQSLMRISYAVFC